DTAEATDTAQLRAKAFVHFVGWLIILAVDFRLDHADDALAGQRILDHSQIGRFENVERKLATGQKQRPFQRENRHSLRTIRARPVTGIAHLHYNLPLGLTRHAPQQLESAWRAKRNLSAMLPTACGQENRSDD